MRNVFQYLATGLLCLALLLSCACAPDPQTTQPAETPPAPEEPIISNTPLVPSPEPTNSADPSESNPGEKAELLIELENETRLVPAVPYHSLHGYTIAYDSVHYECRSYHEVDSYWSEVGLYLSVSIVYTDDLNYVLNGLILQENIHMQPELTGIGSGEYIAYTLYTSNNGLYRQFWVLGYTGHIMLIERSYPLDHPQAAYHRAVQDAMLDTLTLDHPVPAPTVPESPLTAYANALEILYHDRIFPDCSSADPSDSFGSISENRFAIFDIDCDGRDELILEYTTTITAGQILQVYDYDENTYQLRLQFQTYPNVTFYDNGTIEARLSHNQGWGGAFWPYNLYVYDADTDSYTDVGWVDAWDKSVPSSGFPEEIDTSNTGFVYYINSFDPVDYSVYRQWRDSYTGTAEELAVPYQFLTKENIAGIQ